MAKKISALADGSPLLPDDLFVIERASDGFDYKIPASEVGGSGGLAMPAIIGNYYACDWAGSAQVPMANTGLEGAYLGRLFSFPVETTWTEAVIVRAFDNSAPGSLVRLGIYSVGADGLPDELLLDAGEVDTSGSFEAAATISFTTSPDTAYWLALQFNSVLPSLLGVDNTSSETWLNQVVGYPTGIFGGNNTGFSSDAATFGALPDPMPASAWRTDPVPHFLLRIAP